MLHHVENGFVTWELFLAYVLSTLAVIQIWNFTTFYINKYGRNGLRDHIFLFVNMYLLYYMADGIGAEWQFAVYQYSVAWALILINIGIQHLIEVRNHRILPWEMKQLKTKALIIFSEALLVIIHTVLYYVTGISFAFLPILFGIISVMLTGRMNALVPVDFSHLSEREMLYVVFTFGEMIISIASYFSGNMSFNTIYFSVMAFLIIVGLLLSYGTLYNSILDRESQTNGTVYTLIHIFIIFALNNISVALEFMHEDEILLLPKTLFLTSSFVLYYIFLFFTGIFAKKRCVFKIRFVLILALIGLGFIAVMLLFRNEMYINIALSVAFVYSIYFLLYKQGRLQSKAD